MTENSKSAAHNGDPEMGERERLHSLLVPIDLTPVSDRVIGRLARLPLGERALVTLLHVVPGSLAPREQRDAERDAKQSLAEEARHLAASLPRSVRVQAVVKVGGAAREITELAQTQAADLIVMGRGGGRALRNTFLGSTAERVMRTAKLPVLAVRLAPRTAYRRPAMAIDLDESASRVLSWLLWMLPPPRPRVEIVHALQSPYESLAYSSLSDDQVEERRAERRQAASLKLVELLTKALADGGVSAKDAPWKLHVRHGSPRIVVVKQGNADLGLAHVNRPGIAGGSIRWEDGVHGKPEQVQQDRWHAAVSEATPRRVFP